MRAYLFFIARIYFPTLPNVHTCGAKLSRCKTQRVQNTSMATTDNNDDSSNTIGRSNDCGSHSRNTGHNDGNHTGHGPQ